MQYDCDTRPYWTGPDAAAQANRTWGTFIKSGRAYRIDDADTPRPWLNYLCNATFGSVISNRGLGFHWLHSTLFRVTRYEHPIDYLPRDFADGRELFLTEAGQAPVNIWREAADITCTHRPGLTELATCVRDLQFNAAVFVPPDWPAELTRLRLCNKGSTARTLELAFEQTWCFAAFGIHTAEEGIPYLSTPGTGVETETLSDDAVLVAVHDAQLPFPVHGLFFSPQADRATLRTLEEERPDGRIFRFPVARIEHRFTLAPGETRELWLVSAAQRNGAELRALRSDWDAHSGPCALRRTLADRFRLRARAHCALPDADLQHFLNVWFKHQLQLTFYFTRSGHSGYRDSLQDIWGYTLMDPAASRSRLLTVLAHLRADGTAPRNFSNYGDGQHDHRRFMDSGTWIAEALVDLIRETGDWALLEEEVPYLDGGSGTVLEHVWRAGQALFAQRGQHGACLTGDGDWNDALEGISRDGDAVSIWLTMALYHSHRLLAELLAHIGDPKRADLLRVQMAALREVINGAGWDGEWYRYGFTGSGKPIGSKQNQEGRIHLNAQTWAVFSGAADSERAEAAMAAVARELDTPLGAALLAPPYVEEAAEVGRIARLEPGTFENGAIYIHAVAFQVRALLSLGCADEAWRVLKGVLPTNPDNPDARRSSEPYATGNYYCGPGHARYGQNFFTWFTGNPAWFLRIGFDELLGVKADFDGLRIQPRPPSHWTQYSVRRHYRGCCYTVRFTRVGLEAPRIKLNGKAIDGNRVPIQNTPRADVSVCF